MLSPNAAATLQAMSEATQPMQLPMLDPVSEQKLRLSNLIIVGACAISIWDYLDNARADYALATQHKVGIPTAIYFSARISCLAFILLTLSASTTIGPKNCHLIGKIIGTIFFFAAGFISLLFFIRLRAVFLGEKRISYVFGFFWFGATCVQLMYPITLLDLASVLNTQGKEICVIVPGDNTALMTVGPLIAFFIYDTLVLFAISWKITRSALPPNEGPNNGLIVFFTGKYLPAFSRTVLQDNQIYYLCTLPFSIYTVLGTVYSRPGDIFTGFTALIPNSTVITIMACRVFRNTKLNNGSLKEVGNRSRSARDTRGMTRGWQSVTS
ncbi:hypothetical protein CVT24_002928 [Panaeolus cyanescens]|uniref:Chitin synthase export chaperone n=1 Tax=Panaeolus cyanescens TaxID=181874 RepID=A0A409VP72_9AGAR|nr:hypothetical protein CVT24_002928 [Panaeolus cyanescens]